ncbi:MULTISPECIES: hypothetical protein [unclassified Mesorhizobium]|uniref:hypothetical protein n=1 Tax=unclassified Mesorhizobium TaxID=325217 RepID=UPI001125F85E|nr:MULTISPECIES: hypothetical protein [unclassified Mesorhizobium]TPJ51755.1 hypothetical protein FJ426_18790 [Mesorhizobium sp. B2-6-4]TPN42377.1 hypothetical protein FJ979_02205 [Mesorhizobium sp. B1-1-6]
MNVNDLTFNTGRLYTKDGQVIRAVFDANAGVVRFNDFSRMVSGEFPYQRHNNTPQDLALAVMLAYDHGIYTYTREAPRRDPDAEIRSIRL